MEFTGFYEGQHNATLCAKMSVSLNKKSMTYAEEYHKILTQIQ
jgi:hypothetical protein